MKKSFTQYTCTNFRGLDSIRLTYLITIKTRGNDLIIWIEVKNNEKLKDGHGRA